MGILSRTRSTGLGERRTAAAVFAIGAVVALAGDATHVASGTTHYEWDGVPVIWRSAIWFPLLVGGGVLAAAWLGPRYAGTAVNRRGRADTLIAAGAITALYALTSALRGEPDTVTIVLVWALALVIAAWWDPTPGAFAVGAVAAVAGPLVEVLIVEIGAASYAADSDQLLGVAPWLPALYFAAGTVAARLWRAIDTDGA